MTVATNAKRLYHPGETSSRAGTADRIGVEDAIAPRYRDGCGGINTEQLQRDQRAARRVTIRQMVRSFRERWRRR